MTATPPANLPEIDVDAARERAASGACLLDVRTPEEWAAGHAPDSVWIPMPEVTPRQGELPRDRAIVVICRSGARSATVTAALCAAGFDACNVAGGLQAWAGAGHPVVTDTGSPGEIT